MPSPTDVAGTVFAHELGVGRVYRIYWQGRELPLTWFDAQSAAHVLQALRDTLPEVEGT